MTISQSDDESRILASVMTTNWVKLTYPRVSDAEDLEKRAEEPRWKCVLREEALLHCWMPKWLGCSAQQGDGGLRMRKRYCHDEEEVDCGIVVGLAEGRPCRMYH